MKFNVNQNDLQQSLGYCQGVIEKEAHFKFFLIFFRCVNSKLKITQPILI